MARQPPLYSALKRLLEADGNLPTSALTASQYKELTEFGLRTRSVNYTKSGRGGLFRVVEPLVVEQHWRELCPVEADEMNQAWPERSRNLASFRDTKQGPTQHCFHHVFLKAVSSCDQNAKLSDQRVHAPHPATAEQCSGVKEMVSWKRGQTTLDLSQTTRDIGIAALSLNSDDGWYTDQPVWLIENQAPFDRTDWFPATEPSASLIYYAGQIPAKLLDWLAIHPRTSDLVLFPDYDGVGLSNFWRLYEKLEGRCRLWLMPDWRNKLTRYGNAKLWQKTRQDFDLAFSRISSCPFDPALSDTLELMFAMQEKGLALEQESVWI